MGLHEGRLRLRTAEGINIDANLKLDKNGKVSDQEVKFWKVGWEGLKTWFSFTTNDGTAALTETAADSRWYDQNEKYRFIHKIEKTKGGR